MKSLVSIILLCFSFHQLFSQETAAMRLSKTFSQEQFLVNHGFLQNKVTIEKQFITVQNRSSVLVKIPISGLPSGLNSFIFSPDHSHFVAFEERESETDLLYFFKIDGTLLGTHKLDIYPNVTFSYNGQFVTVFNNFGRQVFVFTPSGKEIFREDYIDLIKDNTKDFI